MLSVASVRVKSALSETNVRLPVEFPIVTSEPAVVSAMFAEPSTSNVPDV